MATETIIAVSGVFLSFVSAGISFYYSRVSKRYAAESLNMTKKQYELTHSQTLNQYVTEACANFKTEEALFRYVNSLTISDEEKEGIWRQAFLRVKGCESHQTIFEVSQEFKIDRANRQPWLAVAGQIFKCRTKCQYRNRIWEPEETLEAIEGEEVPYHFDPVNGNANKKPLPQKKNIFRKRNNYSDRAGGWMNDWRK